MWPKQVAEKSDHRCDAEKVNWKWNEAINSQSLTPVLPPARLHLPITSPHGGTQWEPSVQLHKPMVDISHLKDCSDLTGRKKNVLGMLHGDSVP